MRLDRKLLALGLVGGMLGLVATPKAQDSSNWMRTTIEPEEDTTQFGGKNSSAIKDKNVKALWEKFKKGRKSSADDESTRYSSYEMHDANFDGVTDHDGGGNLTEGPTESAFAQKKLGKGQQRHFDLDEQTRLSNGGDKVQYCDNRSDHAACKQNISPVILDIGAAHGGVNEEHRVYAVDRKVQDQLKKNADQIANRIGKEATYYGKDASQANSNRINVNGQQVLVNPDVDKLRSEVAWMEQEKAARITRGWKYLRAKRLANDTDNTRDDIELGRKVESTYVTAKGNTADADERVANVLVERTAYDNEAVCVDKKNNISPKKGGNIGCGNLQEMSVADVISSAKAEKKLNASQLSALRENVLSNAKISLSAKPSSEQKKFYDDYAQKKQTLKECMGENAWCGHDGLDKKEPGKLKDFAKLKGRDIGETYKDTRELTYNTFDKANRGPMNNFMQTVTNMDMSPSQTQANRDQWNEVNKQYVHAQNQHDDFITKVQAAATAHPQYNQADNAFLQKNLKGREFDPSKQSIQQVFGLNEKRDATTTGQYVVNPTGKGAQPASNPSFGMNP